MQAVPALRAGILLYAGDDGPIMGQAYRLSLDLDQRQVTVALRTPDETGAWVRTWRDKTVRMVLPEVVVARLIEGKMLAPSLREIIEPEGTRYVVLDFMVEVPVEKQATWEEMRTVLGFDWGITTLVAASAVESSARQWGCPL